MKCFTMSIMLLAFAASAANAQAVTRAVTTNDLKNIQVFIESASAETGKVPSKEAIVEALKMAKAANLVKLIEEGAIVLTGTTERESVWAYDKNAPEKGGFILSNSGIEKLDAAEVKKRLGK
ncbi:MAG: hypothetical protein K8T89_18575 [Planctomycetes bacterium]|nr:hypothetical protein [Planctomycetota bacterium]